MEEIGENSATVRLVPPYAQGVGSADGVPQIRNLSHSFIFQQTLKKRLHAAISAQCNLVKGRGTTRQHQEKCQTSFPLTLYVDFVFLQKINYVAHLLRRVLIKSASALTDLISTRRNIYAAGTGHQYWKQKSKTNTDWTVYFIPSTKMKGQKSYSLYR